MMRSQSRVRFLIVLPLVLMSAGLSGCGQTPDKSGQLLTMAGQEAASIPNVLDRFTRQLNIADTQLRTNRKPAAAATLALARDTLAASGKEGFGDFQRIAGWTAISQLARQAQDRDLAMKASDEALAALNDVQPATARPQYVLSLSGELAELRGKEAAIELLNSGAAWAADLPDAETRRFALVTFTQALLNHDAFETARAALRRDPDAAWRTDTFLALADRYAHQAQPPIADQTFAATPAATSVREASAPTASAEAVAQPMSMESFNKDVRFERNFKR